MKNNKMKKVLTAMLASMMLLGMSVTSNAQSADAAREDTHVHYYKAHRSYYNSYVLETHIYLKAIIEHENGRLEEVYDTCYKVAYMYDLVYECQSCGDSYKNGGGREVRHMQCGAPNEG